MEDRQRGAGQYYYEDSRAPWRPDRLLPVFLAKEKRKQQRQREHRTAPRALDLGMGYGRNALWLAERGYAVEGWERDRRYVAEARREARRRARRGRRGPLELTCHLGDFRRARLRGPYEVIVISNALHQVPRSAALRVLARARTALARGGLMFLLVKLARDRHFQRTQKDPNWQRWPGERNTLRHRRRRDYVLSALEPAEVKAALRGLRIRHQREVTWRSAWEWEEDAPVTHRLVEMVAEKRAMPQRQTWKDLQPGM